MPVGQLISLGVGSPADIKQLVLTGLSLQPSGAGVVTAEISLDGAVVLAANTIYVMPARIVNFEWLVSAAAIIEGSLDQLTWQTIDTATVAGNRQVLGSVWPFIRPSAVTTILVKKAKKL
jgi:hypothetical protein